MIDLSVIVPVCNCAETLRRCLDSVVAAVNRANVPAEIVCVDDGSSDGSEKVLDEYARWDLRFRVVRQANAGVSQARQTGLRCATGAFVGWVDADDWVEPEHFATLLSAARGTGADLVTCDIVRERGAEQERLDQSCGWHDARTLLVATLTRQVMSAVWNRLYRLSAIQAAKVDFPASRDCPIMEDTFFNSLFLLSDPSVAHVSSASYHYVVRTGSLSCQGETADWWRSVVVANGSIEKALAGKANAHVLRQRWSIFKGWMFWAKGVPDEMFYAFHPEIRWLSSSSGMSVPMRLLVFLATFGGRSQIRRLVRKVRG